MRFLRRAALSPLTFSIMQELLLPVGAGQGGRAVAVPTGVWAQGSGGHRASWHGVLALPAGYLGTGAAVDGKHELLSKKWLKVTTAEG